MCECLKDKHIHREASLLKKMEKKNKILVSLHQLYLQTNLFKLLIATMVLLLLCEQEVVTHFM